MKPQIKCIVENTPKGDVLLKVRVFKVQDIPAASEADVKNFFDSQKREGFTFLKAFKERNGENYSLFCSISDLDYFLAPTRNI